MNDAKIIESRKITKKEIDEIISLINKYKLNANNFITNSNDLVINKIDYNEFIPNGYDAKNNIIFYNNQTNLTREFIHVASSTRDMYQGICIKPNETFPECIGVALNEGIADMFLELYNKQEGNFPFEKICAKTLKHAFTIKLFNFYFLNNDAAFRHFFNKDVYSFYTALDEYCKQMFYLKKIYKKNNNINELIKINIKIQMTDVINELLNIVDDSNKQYCLNLLKSKTMKPIYDIIGEYNYEDYNK